MSKEIVQRVRLLMNYDTEKTLTENFSVIKRSNLIESKILQTIIAGTGKGTVDDILRRTSILDDAGKAITSRKDLAKFISTGSKPLVSKAVAKLNVEFLKSPGVARASKSLIIDEMVKNKTFINQFAGKSSSQISTQLKSLGYSDDIAQEIGKKVSAANRAAGKAPKPKPKRKPPRKPQGGVSDSIWRLAYDKIILGFSWANFLKWGLGLGLSAAILYYIWTWFTGEEPTDDDGKKVTPPSPTPKPSSYRNCDNVEFLSFGCKASVIKRLQECIGFSGKDVDGAWGRKTQARMVQLGLGQGILVSDIDQICKTSDQAEQDAEKKSIENRDPKVRGSEDIIDYTSNQQNPNINVSTDTSVDDLS
jgi:hypothetical protein